MKAFGDSVDVSGQRGHPADQSPRTRSLLPTSIGTVGLAAEVRILYAGHAPSLPTMRPAAEILHNLVRGAEDLLRGW